MEELRAGDTIKERYKLVRFLGSGSFGEVWLAHDLLTGRDVALKIYLSLDPAGVEQFQREYANTIDLLSPHLLTPEYFDIYGRRPFLVMKYCKNGSSSKLVGNISEELLWQFIHDVAKGLEVLHNQTEPIVHQDIKPDNILIDGDGRFVITDFGISKRLRSTMRRQSKRDINSGAMPYMAPERFNNNPRLNTASDIWSLGASIYELATGELPFSGFGGAMQKNGADMPSLTKNFSPILNEIMQLCLNPKPENRPNAVELSEWVKSKTIPNTQSLTLHMTVVKQQTSTQASTQATKVIPHPVKLLSHIYTWVFVFILAVLSVVFIFVRKPFNSENAVVNTSQSMTTDSVTEQVENVSKLTAEQQIINSPHITQDGQVIHFYKGAFYYKKDIYPVMIAFIMTDDRIQKVIYKNITYGGEIAMSYQSQGDKVSLSGKDGNNDFSIILFAGDDNRLLGSAVEGEKSMNVRLMPSTEPFEIKERYNYLSFKIGSGSISVPDFLKYNGESEDGGSIFRNGQVRLFVDYLVDQDLGLYHEWTTNEIGNGSPVYDLVKSYYFVQSGYNYDGEVYYTKAYLDTTRNPHGLYCATIIYPVNEKKRIDKLLSRIFNKFPNIN